MTRRMICIECPNGCSLSADIDNGIVRSVTGARCPKGKDYAIAEAERPVRILTATVVAEGLSLKLVPVRTDKPIPKKDITRAMDEIRALCVQAPVAVGDTVCENFLGLGVRLIATREVARG